MRILWPPHTVQATISTLPGPLEDPLRANSLAYALGDVEHKATDFRKLNARVREATTGTGAATSATTKAKAAKMGKMPVEKKVVTVPKAAKVASATSEGPTAKVPAKALALPKPPTAKAPVAKKPATNPKRKAELDVLTETKPKKVAKRAPANAVAGPFNSSLSALASASTSRTKPKLLTSPSKPPPPPPPYSSNQISVGGLWRLDCPKMSDQYPQHSDPFHFILRQPRFDGFFEGSFSLGLFFGALRSVPGPRTTHVVGQGTKQVTYVRFEWQGRGVDNAISRGEGWIRFFATGTGPQGTTLKGVLDGEFGPCESEGRRDEAAGWPEVEEGMEWGNFSQARYDWEEVARWWGGMGSYPGSDDGEESFVEAW
mgnify:CR=1 FL=1